MAIDATTVRTTRTHFIFPPDGVLDDIGRTLFVITFVVLVGSGGFCTDLLRRRRVELQEQDIDFLWSRGYARSVGATACTLCRRCRRLGCLVPSTRQRMLAFRGTFLVLNARQRGWLALTIVVVILVGYRVFRHWAYGRSADVLDSVDCPRGNGWRVSCCFAAALVCRFLAVALTCRR